MTPSAGGRKPKSRLTSLERQLLRAWNAGRVTIPSYDFLEFIADRLDRAEGHVPPCEAYGSGYDYCIRLRKMAAAAREVLKPFEEDHD